MPGQQQTVAHEVLKGSGAPCPNLPVAFEFNGNGSESSCVLDKVRSIVQTAVHKSCMGVHGRLSSNSTPTDGWRKWFKYSDPVRVFI